MTKKIPAAEFVTAWQTSSSIAEVAKRTGLIGNTAYQRAIRYRKMGIGLKRFETARGPRPLDIGALAQLAKKLVA